MSSAVVKNTWELLTKQQHCCHKPFNAEMLQDSAPQTLQQCKLQTPILQASKMKVLSKFDFTINTAHVLRLLYYILPKRLLHWLSPTPNHHSQFRETYLHCETLLTIDDKQTTLKVRKLLPSTDCWPQQHMSHKSINGQVCRYRAKAAAVHRDARSGYIWQSRHCGSSGVVR